MAEPPREKLIRVVRLVLVFSEGNSGGKSTQSLHIFLKKILLQIFLDIMFAPLAAGLHTGSGTFRSLGSLYNLL